MIRPYGWGAVGSDIPDIRRRPLRSSAEAQIDQGPAIDDGEAIAAGAHRALLVPAAHEADGRFDGGTGEVRQLLARQHHGDEDLPFRRSPHVLGEIEKEAGETDLHPAAAVRHSVGELHQSAGEAGQQAPNEGGPGLEELEEGTLADGQAGRRFQGGGGGGIGPVLIDRHGPHRGVGSEEFQDDVPAVRGRLGDLDPTFRNHHEVVRWIPFPKDHLPAAVGTHFGDRGEAVTVFLRKLSEERVLEQ